MFLYVAFFSLVDLTVQLSDLQLCAEIKITTINYANSGADFNINVFTVNQNITYLFEGPIYYTGTVVKKCKSTDSKLTDVTGVNIQHLEDDDAYHIQVWLTLYNSQLEILFTQQEYGMVSENNPYLGFWIDGDESCLQKPHSKCCENGQICSLQKIGEMVIVNDFYALNFDENLQNEIVVMIPFNGRVGTLQALAPVLNIPDLEKLLNSGCWCSTLKSGNYESEYIQNMKFLELMNDSHPGPVSSLLDGYCKRWIHDRRCVNLPGGLCYESESSHYPLKIRTTQNETYDRDMNFCLDNNDDCESNKCLIDIHYSNLIVEEFYKSTSNPSTGLENCYQWENEEAKIGLTSECQGTFNFTARISEFAIIHKQKECSCKNGTATIGPECPNDGQEFCDYCENGFTLTNVTNKTTGIISPTCVQCNCLQNSTTKDCFQVCWSTDPNFCPFAESCESILVFERHKNYLGINDCEMYLTWSKDFGPTSLDWNQSRGILNVYGPENCNRWHEPNDPDTWRDNYMCVNETFPFETLFVNNQEIFLSEVENYGFIENDCVNLNRPFQKPDETWEDNYFCIKKTDKENRKLSEFQNFDEIYFKYEGSG